MLAGSLPIADCPRPTDSIGSGACAHRNGERVGVGLDRRALMTPLPLLLHSWAVRASWLLHEREQLADIPMVSPDFGEEGKSPQRAERGSVPCYQT